jgi:hypothetical protein
MQFSQIRLQQTYAQIGIRTTQPVQEIQQTPAKISIKQVPTQLSIERQPGQMIIDQEQAWNELGFKKISTLIADTAEFAKQEALAAVAEIAQAGDQLARIENKGDVIVAQSTEKGNPPPRDTILAFIPSHGSVKFQYTPTELKINWKKGGAEILPTQYHTTEHNYTPGKTEVYLRQKQGLEIDFVGLFVDNKS